ncbi:hypothetical protein JCM3770_004912 [Rhodotorula araucariae]
MNTGSVTIIVEWFTVPIVSTSSHLSSSLGVVLCLISQYWQRFGSKDRLVFRLFVGLFTVLLLADTANACAWSFRYAVTGQLHPAKLFELPVEFCIYSLITGLTVLIAQGFFTWRIWIISGRKNHIFPGIVLAIQLAAFGVAIYMIYAALQRPLFADFDQVKGAPWAWLACGLLVDVLTTGGTVYYLLIKPRLIGASRDAIVHSPLRRVVLITARTNALWLLMQALTLWLIIWKLYTFHYAIPGFLECKVYVASVVITLNSRGPTGAALANFSDADASLPPRSPKPFGGFPGGARPHVQVRIDEETRSDSASRLEGLHAGGAQPFAVKLDRSPSDESGWTVGEKSGDVELGRMEDVRIDGASDKF